MKKYPRIVIAGVRGGSGKTTLSLGLIAALRSQKGLSVIPFKKGPDYIDAGWMSAAANNPCYNLDPFFLTKEKIMESFISHFTGDIAVIEGNRGVYDGMDVEGSYSTAELAKQLKAPVILVLDCTKMTRTAAAIVLGCLNMDRDVNIKGVVLNHVSGGRHESIVRQSIQKYCSMPVLGAIPRLKSGEMPERHMGLTPFQEHPNVSKAIEIAGEAALKYLDLDAIFDIAGSAEPLNDRNELCVMGNELKTLHASRITDYGLRSFAHHKVRIGVVRDSAFQFYYPENFEELQKRGAEIIEVNAINDTDVPDIDALYIGGGFPETHAVQLAANEQFRQSIKSAVEKGLPVYAECGGLMFMSDALIIDGIEYPMVGIFPLVFEMRRRPQAHGYTVVQVERSNPFYPVGIELHGHEFHYSAVTGVTDRDGVHTAFGMKRGSGIYDKQDGICYKNTLATYTHIHALGEDVWAEGLIGQALIFKKIKEESV
jgi:cobyrinic acid a,c-diamide synthase